MVWNQQTATQYGLSSGLLQPGEQATGGLLQQRADAAGVNLVPTIQSANVQPTYGAPATYQTGAMPVGVEPLHQFERTSLSALGAYQAPQAFSQAATGLGGAMNMAQQYAQPITPEQFQQGLQTYSDPYQQQVTDVALQDIDEQAAGLRNRIINRNPGARSFGSSAMGTQLAQLGGEQQQARAGAIARGGQQAFQGATDFMLRNRAQGLQGLGAMGNIAGQLGGLGVRQQQADLQRLGAQGAAGRDIRQFNQGLSDIAMQNYMKGQNYPYQNLSNLGSLMAGIPGTNLSYYQTPGAGQQWGAGLTALGTAIRPAQGVQ